MVIRTTSVPLAILLVLVTFGLDLAAAGDPSSQLWRDVQGALAAGRWTEARQALTLYVERYPDSPLVPDALFELARTEADEQQARLRLERLRDKFSRTEAGARAAIRLAQADMANGSVKSIPGELRNFTHARFSLAVRRTALLLIAEAEQTTGDLSGAERDFGRLLEMEPGEEETSRAFLGLAGIARSRRDPLEEERYLSTVYEQYPEGDLASVALWKWSRSLRDQGNDTAAGEKMALLNRRFPDSAEGVSAREKLLESAKPPASRREVGRPRAAAPGDSTVPRSAGRKIHFVLTGRFATWEAADSLRARLGAKTETPVRVVPGREGSPPFAVQAGEFSLLADAVRFSTWVEAETGFESRLVESEELAPQPSKEP